MVSYLLVLASITLFVYANLRDSSTPRDGPDDDDPGATVFVIVAGTQFGLWCISQSRNCSGAGKHRWGW